MGPTYDSPGMFSPDNWLNRRVSQSPSQEQLREVLRLQQINYQKTLVRCGGVPPHLAHLRSDKRRRFKV